MKYPKYIIVKFLADFNGEHRARSISVSYLPAMPMEWNVQYARDVALIRYDVLTIGSVILKY